MGQIPLGILRGRKSVRVERGGIPGEFCRGVNRDDGTAICGGVNHGGADVLGNKGLVLNNEGDTNRVQKSGWDSLTGKGAGCRRHRRRKRSTDCLGNQGQFFRVVYHVACSHTFVHVHFGQTGGVVVVHHQTTAEVVREIQGVRTVARGRHIRHVCTGIALAHAHTVWMRCIFNRVHCIANRVRDITGGRKPLVRCAIADPRGIATVPVNSSTILGHFDWVAILIKLRRAIGFQHWAAAGNGLIHRHGQFTAHTVPGAYRIARTVCIGKVVGCLNAHWHALGCQDDGAKIVWLVHEVDLIAIHIFDGIAIRIRGCNVLGTDQAGYVFQARRNCRGLNLHIATQTCRVGQIGVQALGVFDDGDFVVVVRCLHLGKGIDPLFSDRNWNAGLQIRSAWQVFQAVVNATERINEFADGGAGIHRDPAGSGQTTLNAVDAADICWPNTLRAARVICLHIHRIASLVGVNTETGIGVRQVSRELCGQRQRDKYSHSALFKASSLDLCHFAYLHIDYSPNKKLWFPNRRLFIFANLDIASAEMT